MTNFFFKKEGRKYLRKKSDLVKDYLLGGCFLMAFGFAVKKLTLFIK